MILIEKEDVLRIGLNPIPFYIKWEIGSPEAVAADYDDVIADGPFLLVMNDDEAWAGQSLDQLHLVARKQNDSVNRRRWCELADLYVADLGWSRRSLVKRILAVQDRLRDAGGEWVQWRKVYHWRDGSDRVWSGLYRHQWIETKERYGEREARYRVP